MCTFLLLHIIELTPRRPFALSALRVFPLVLGILIDMTITFKLVSNIRRLDDKFSDVKKILERHNMIACAAMTLVATGCTLIFAATRSVGMMSILRFPLVSHVAAVSCLGSVLKHSCTLTCQ